MEDKRIERRKHSAEFKAEVIRACDRPGTSVSGVALAHGINANLLRRWLQQDRVKATAVTPLAVAPRQCDGGASRDAFMALAVAPPASEPPVIRVEVRRGATSINVTWPLEGARDCATWLREWLQ